MNTTVFLLLSLLIVPLIGQTRQDPPADQHYDLVLVTKEGREGIGCHFIGNGPVGEAEDCDLSKGLTVDSSGNAYYTNTAYSVMRRYSKTKDMVSSFTGGAKGYLDGPVSRARFGGWGYNNTNCICASDDGKHVFLRDGVNKQWRYINVDSGMVSTVGPTSGTGGAYLIIAKDCISGEIYAFMPNGTTPPDCGGYKKLTTAVLSFSSSAFDGIALDVTKMRFYYHYRGPSYSMDLSTGISTQITGALWCPTGMSISQSGRYLYIGGGDDMFCWRNDLESSDTLFALGRSKALNTANGVNIWFMPKANNSDYAAPISGSSNWPGAVVFPSDGSYGLWAGRHGLFHMIPRN